MNYDLQFNFSHPPAVESCCTEPLSPAQHDLHFILSIFMIFMISDKYLIII